MSKIKIDADYNKVIDILTDQVAKLTRENAIYLAATTEAQEKIKELEDKNAKKK